MSCKSYTIGLNLSMYASVAGFVIQLNNNADSLRIQDNPARMYAKQKRLVISLLEVENQSFNSVMKNWVSLWMLAIKLVCHLFVAFCSYLPAEKSQCIHSS